MSGLRHGWGSEDNGHADFVHGGVPIEDFDEEVKHVKKKQKGCKKSRDKKPCDFINEVTHRQWYSHTEERWYGYTVMTCSRCGKHGNYKFF